jgi:recombinational DNA repair protein RecR
MVFIAFQLRGLKRSHRQLIADMEQIQRHTSDKLTAHARDMVQNHGAGHDCSEWTRNGQCELCDRRMDERPH